MGTLKGGILTLGCVLLLLAAVLPEPEPYTWRFRLLSGGLFFCWVSTFPYFAH